jgi:hypothetical protein
MWLIILLPFVAFLLYLESRRWINRTKYHVPEVPILGALPYLLRHKEDFLDANTEFGRRYRIFDSVTLLRPHFIITREREDIQFVLKDEFWLFEKGETVNTLLGTYVTCNSARAYTH